MFDTENYIGHKINTITKHISRKRFNGEIVEYDNVELAPNDPVIADIMARHSSVRFHMPADTMSSCDFDMSRMNVHIEQNEAGEYVITAVDWG